MSYREIEGNLFASKADAFVNTVNCVGPMGKGIALEFRRRFPEMFAAYKMVCEKGELRPGHILPYTKSKPLILNFAVKDDWKQPSRIEWVEQCLQKFCDWYPDQGLESVAFPWMGAMNGRIPVKQIKEVTRKYLSPLEDIDVEVYAFDPKVPDPLFDLLLECVEVRSQDDFKRYTKIDLSKTKQLYELVLDSETQSLTDVVTSGILGETTQDHLYKFLVECQRNGIPPPRSQQTLNLQ
jgi:O-acetyl-ADP-ribose deacetylase (regulator of RNase III)